MNTSTQRILIAVLVLLFVGSAGQYWLTQQALEASHLEMTQLRATVEQLNSEVATLQAQVAQLDKSSVQGVVREANSVLLDGWNSLMSTVESELVKAREAIETQPAGQAAQTVKPPVTTQPNSSVQP